MARYRNPLYTGSSNPWAAGFSNLGAALFGDPQAMQQQAALQALMDQRDMSAQKTAAETEALSRKAKNLADLQTVVGTTLNTHGQPLTRQNVFDALSYAEPMAIGADYKPQDLAEILRTGAAFGGDSDLMRQAQIGAGGDPSLDFAGTQEEADAILRHKPFNLAPNETHVVPPSRFQGQPAPSPTSMESVVEPSSYATGSSGASTPTTGEMDPATQVAYRPGQVTNGKLTSHQAPEIFDQYIQQASQMYGVPYDLLRELLWRESHFNPNARGAAGEVGIAQFRPQYTHDLGYNIESFDPGDPESDIFHAAQYLHGLHQEFGDWDTALTAYNWGPQHVRNFGVGRRPVGTRDYTHEILTNAGYLPGPEQEQQQAQQAAATEPAAGAPAQTQVQTQPQQQQVAQAVPPTPDIFGPQGGTMRAPPPPLTEVSANASLYSTDAAGKPVLEATAPADATGLPKQIDQPSVDDENAIYGQIAMQLGVDMKADMPTIIHTIGGDHFQEYSDVIRNTWQASHGSIDATAAAAASWINQHYVIHPDSESMLADTTVVPKEGATFATPTTPTTGAPTTTAPATTAPAVHQDLPPAEQRVIGDTYQTPKGPLIWTGIPGNEWARIPTGVPPTTAGPSVPTGP